MICLKICTFVVSATTQVSYQDGSVALWFAWKFVPLWYQQQQPLKLSEVLPSCDLLENLYLCGISNNLMNWVWLPITVVICLKICTFVVSATTNSNAMQGYLGCDLLENLYLCGISNNKFLMLDDVLQLWFAWKFVPLWYQQQHQIISMSV